MIEFDSKKSEMENVTNKLADIRSLIWEKYPAHQGEMIGDPYSVACYAHEEIEKLQKKVEILTKACEKIELTATLREDNLAITARRALKECKELG